MAGDRTSDGKAMTGILDLSRGLFPPTAPQQTYAAVDPRMGARPGDYELAPTMGMELFKKFRLTYPDTNFAQLAIPPQQAPILQDDYARIMQILQSIRGMQPTPPQAPEAIDATQRNLMEMQQRQNTPAYKNWGPQQQSEWEKAREEELRKIDEESIRFYK